MTFGLACPLRTGMDESMGADPAGLASRVVAARGERDG